MIMLLTLFSPVWHLLALVTWSFTTERIVALSQGRNVKPALITSDEPGQEGFVVGGELTKFSADVVL
jgi:hypothetical protein